MKQYEQPSIHICMCSDVIVTSNDFTASDIQWSDDPWEGIS